MSEERRNVSKSSDVRTASELPSRSVKVSGDSHLVPLVSKMRCDDERESGNDQEPSLSNLSLVKAELSFLITFTMKRGKSKGRCPLSFWEETSTTSIPWMIFLSHRKGGS